MSGPVCLARNNKQCQQKKKQKQKQIEETAEWME